MCGIHYGEVEGLVSVERWSCSKGASCTVEYAMGRLRTGLCTQSPFGGKLRKWYF